MGENMKLLFIQGANNFFNYLNLLNEGFHNRSTFFNTAYLLLPINSNSFMSSELDNIREINDLKFLDRLKQVYNNIKAVYFIPTPFCLKHNGPQFRASLLNKYIIIEFSTDKTLNDAPPPLNIR